MIIVFFSLHYQVLAVDVFFCFFIFDFDEIVFDEKKFNFDTHDDDDVSQESKIKYLLCFDGMTKFFFYRFIFVSTTTM